MTSYSNALGRIECSGSSIASGAKICRFRLANLCLARPAPPLAIRPSPRTPAAKANRTGGGGSGLKALIARILARATAAESTLIKRPFHLMDPFDLLLELHDWLATARQDRSLGTS